jgi:heme-degrading monooxygenase HmoA
MFVTIWKYKVKSDKKEEFVALYGVDGDWVRLFKNFSDYVKTTLLKDINDSESYVTLDYWKSKEVYYDFKLKAVEEFKRIDEIGEELTLSEEHLGEFEIQI